ncbi:MAG TPA: ABC transporter permease [Candidatus Limnocylindrales bacterium]|nr:ABC transporter permease [Candidatus Limnocylindrales bacterium]
MGGRLSRVALRLAAAATLIFLYVPIFIVVVYAFNDSKNQSWSGLIDRLGLNGFGQTFSLRWFDAAINNDQVRESFFLSVQAALGATLVALLLGSAAAFAVHRHRFFGRDGISFILVLPIALPGIVTGMALNAAMNAGIDGFDIGPLHVTGPDFGLATIVVGHATFCVVVVYNNVVARLRRLGRSLEEASMDLGADTWQTFRRITLPALATALFAGALLAFALSFDEIIVTTFTAGTEQTLPIWIFANFRLPNQRPIVNVVALAMILLSLIPVYISARLAGAESVASAR